MTFRIGQKVVCVNADPSFSCGCPTGLTHGAIYTITGIPVERGVLIREVNAVKWCGAVLYRYHTGFFAERFRPLVERKADMEARKALFDKLLNSSDETIDG